MRATFHCSVAIFDLVEGEIDVRIAPADSKAGRGSQFITLNEDFWISPSGLSQQEEKTVFDNPAPTLVFRKRGLRVAWRHVFNLPV